MHCWLTEYKIWRLQNCIPIPQEDEMTIFQKVILLYIKNMQNKFKSILQKSVSLK